MSNCCNSCGSYSNNDLSIDSLTKIIEDLVSAKTLAELKAFSDKVNVLDEKIELLNSLITQAQEAADIAVAAKNNIQVSVETVNASMAMITEKLEDGFNINPNIIVNNTKYYFKHGILVKVEDI